ncbi:MAG: hypothetical protein AAF664_22000 [Planctomycetota bacterium]
MSFFYISKADRQKLRNRVAVHLVTLFLLGLVSLGSRLLQDRQTSHAAISSTTLWGDEDAWRGYKPIAESPSDGWRRTIRGWEKVASWPAATIHGGDVSLSISPHGQPMSIVMPLMAVGGQCLGVSVILIPLLLNRET